MCQETSLWYFGVGAKVFERAYRYVQSNGLLGLSTRGNDIKPQECGWTFLFHKMPYRKNFKKNDASPTQTII